MSRFEEKIKAKMDSMIKGTEIERLSDDDDVRQWLLMGRIAAFATVWLSMISIVALVVSLRF